jgi:hypothetical protein
MGELVAPVETVTLCAAVTVAEVDAAALAVVVWVVVVAVPLDAGVEAVDEVVCELEVAV